MWNVIEDANGRPQITRRHRCLVGKSCKPRCRERLLGKRGGRRRAPGGWRCQDVDHPLWLNETSGSLQPLALPEHSDLHPPPPHAWGPPSQSHQHVPVQVAAAQAAPEPPPPSATCPAPGHLSPAAKRNIPTGFMCYKRTVSGRLIQVIVKEQSHALCVGNGFFPASTLL